MKIALLATLTLAALALLGIALFSGPGPEIGLLKLDLLEVHQANQDLERKLAEAKEQIDALSGQISFLENGALPANARASTPSPAEIAAAAERAAANSGSGNGNAGETPGDPFTSHPTPEQAAWLDAAVRDTLRHQAEDQRRRILDAQVQFVRSKFDDVAEKMKLQGMQKDQAAQAIENYLRNRSDIRGTRSWWEFSNDEWDAMRARLKENDKWRNEQLGQILSPEQMKDLKQWEKKRPGWFNPGSNFNPRGGDF